jgi:hypothetical protein
MRKKKAIRTVTESVNDLRTTSEDWYPCWPGGKVQVRVVWVVGPKETYGVVSVWGYDDHGLQRLFTVDQYDEFLSFVERLPTENVTHAALEALGLK